VGERTVRDNEISLFEWMWLMVIALVAVPIAAMLSALVALDVTRSLEAHVATAMLVPLGVVFLIARRFGAPDGVALRLALVGALAATVLLDLGWSGSPAG
jgi:hypothetical protein